VRIETDNVQSVEVHPDACNGFEIVCPECGDKVIVATASWWSDKCECGYSWSVNLRAVGEK